MKEFNKEEYNKMCALFLGWELKSYPSYMDTPFCGQSIWFSPASSDGKSRTFSARVGEEYFDSDWNWIMEVVDKIENELKYIIQVTSSPTISSKWLHHIITIKSNTVRDVFHGGYIVKYESDYSNNQSKKDAMVQAIWEFLNWYNQQEK